MPKDKKTKDRVKSEPYEKHSRDHRHIKIKKEPESEMDTDTERGRDRDRDHKIKKEPRERSQSRASSRSQSKSKSKTRTKKEEKAKQRAKENKTKKSNKKMAMIQEYSGQLIPNSSTHNMIQAFADKHSHLFDENGESIKFKIHRDFPLNIYSALMNRLENVFLHAKAFKDAKSSEIIQPYDLALAIHLHLKRDPLKHSYFPTEYPTRESVRKLLKLDEVKKESESPERQEVMDEDSDSDQDEEKARHSSKSKKKDKNKDKDKDDDHRKEKKHTDSKKGSVKKEKESKSHRK